MGQSSVHHVMMLSALMASLMCVVKQCTVASRACAATSRCSRHTTCAVPGEWLTASSSWLRHVGGQGSVRTGEIRLFGQRADSKASTGPIVIYLVRRASM